MGSLISYFFGESYPTEATDLRTPPADPTEVTEQTEDSSPVASSSPNPEKEKSDLSYIPHENTPRDTARPESIFQTTSASDHTEDVDKRDIYVIYAGKQTEISIFPLEKISYLLQQACDQVQKKPENMRLIFDGEPLDLTKTLRQYPKLRSGKKVQLIRAF